METSHVLERALAGCPDREGAEQAMTRSLDLASLYDAYAGPLYRYLVALLSCEQDAEDALQEVFLGLARRRADRIRDTRAYLLKAARHQAFQALRRRRRREREAAMAAVSWVDPEACRPEVRVLALDIDRALCSLPAEQREVVTLHLCEGFSFREIAELCGVPQNTASSRYRLALARLRELLKGGDGDG
jgi:RNA polymerase sigma-70 factor (ECF subfamily)